MAGLLVSLALLSAGLHSAAGPTQDVARPAAEGARAPGVSFDETARKAEEAWTAGRSDEALRLLEAGLELNPLWRDGWWRLGLVYTEAGRFADAREALLRLVSLEPDAGPAWALLGLCEYRLRDYESALAHLWKGTSLGGFDDEALQRESLLHFALLLMRSGDFGSAASPLARVVARRHTDPALQAACGVFALQMPRLPDEVPPEDQDLVATAGGAECAALALRADEARSRFETLVARYPRTRGVHLAYGCFLRHEALPGALSALREEVRLFPDNAQAQAELAFEILERHAPAEALSPAREAARLAPGQPAARLAYGRALVATGAADQAVVELEEAARLAPEDGAVWLALAQAYAGAGRTADAGQARARLIELERKRGARPER